MYLYDKMKLDSRWASHFDNIQHSRYLMITNNSIDYKQNNENNNNDNNERIGNASNYN